jgi:GlpG protein
MRQVGNLPSEAEARRFVAYLLQQNIDALVEHASDQWVVWVRSEDQRADAQAAMEHFVANPRDPRYQQAEKSVEFQRHESVRRTAPIVQISWRHPFGNAINRPDVVLAVIVITTLVTLASWLPVGSLSDTLSSALQFMDTTANAPQDPFFSIKRGEFWRLITPIFIHFSWQHILLNLMIFYYLAAQIERLRGPVALGLLMLLLAIISNTAQAYFGGPNFGGISGVVFGLLGYIWIKSSYEAESGFVLNPFVLIVAMGLLIVSLFWPTDKIANYAHLGGLITGIVIGMTPSRRDEPSLS